jgi:tetratricopeptide (TPR) repeat protein
MTTRRRLQITPLLLLPVFVFLGLYLRALDYDFVWTDQGEIEHGILIQPPDRWLEVFWQPMHPQLAVLSPGSAQPYYRPLQVALVSFIDYEYGRRPRHFRLACIALGAATVLLFTLFAQVLMRDPGMAALAGAVFAVHPAGIENYVWIAGLSAALATFFIVASLLAGKLALEAPSAARRAGWLALSMAALSLGLLSKESAAVTPALALACIASVVVLERRRNPDGGTSMPAFFWKTATMLISLQGLITAVFVFWWRPRVLGGMLAGAPPIGGSSRVQLLTGVATWPDCLTWLFLPLQSTTSDVVRLVSSAFEPMLWMGAALALGSLVAWFVLLRRGLPIAALGLAWLWIAFLPTSGLVPLTHVRAERYLSLSVLGLALIWAELVPGLARLYRSRGRRLLTAALGVLLVSGLAQRSWARIPDWRSDLVLFERDVSRDPLFREGYYVLAVALLEEGRLEEAKGRLEELQRTGSRFAGHRSFLRSMDAFALYCGVNLRLGEGRDTLRMFRDNLRADAPDLPAAPSLFRCGAKTLERAGRVEEALEIFLRLRSLEPGAPDPRLTVAVARCHARLARYAEARAWLDRLPSGASRDRRIRADAAEVRDMIRTGAAPRKAAPDGGADRR